MKKKWKNKASETCFVCFLFFVLSFFELYFLSFRYSRSQSCHKLHITWMGTNRTSWLHLPVSFNLLLKIKIFKWIYVRIGRTGRTGQTGDIFRAVSFFSTGNNDKFARQLFRFLVDSNAVIPQFFIDLAEGQKQADAEERRLEQERRRMENLDAVFKT